MKKNRYYYEVLSDETVKLTGIQQATTILTEVKENSRKLVKEKE